MDAAGKYLRSGSNPDECPNDTAFYLFRQAVEEPKDFMAKVSQMELKIDKEEELRQNARRDGQRTVAEIKSFLAEISNQEEGNDEEE
jgi:hypothetical protein